MLRGIYPALDAGLAINNNFYLFKIKSIFVYKLILKEKMNIPEDLKYTKDHEWLKVDGKTGIVGITDYAQNELGDIIYVDIPAMSDVKQGETFGTIEAVKTVSDMLAPVSGKLTEINKSVNDNPAIVNTAPYNEGWLVKIELSDLSELDGLLTADAYKNLIGM